MKKLLFIIFLLISIFSIDKVYAIDNTLYNYNVYIIVNKQKDVIEVEERFETKEIDEEEFFLKEIGNSYSVVESNIESLHAFKLKSNAKYTIKYQGKCNLTDCTFIFRPIKYRYNFDNSNTLIYNSFFIDMFSKDETNLPDHYTEHDGSTNYIVTYNNGVNHITMKDESIYDEYRIIFKDESIVKIDPVKNNDDEYLEKLDKQADSLYALLIVASMFISATLTISFSRLCESVKKKTKELENNDNMSVLRDWTNKKQHEVHHKAVNDYLVILIIVVMFSLALFYALIHGIASNITPNAAGVVIYSIGFIFVNIFINILPIIYYANYCELKVLYDVKRGTLIKCDSYSLNTTKNDNEITYKIDATITVNGEQKRLSSGRKKVDKLEEMDNVFVLYINDNHYYVDYLNN